MPHASSFDALVLKTYDVGEADRFCIFLTRERGRIAARAAGARRPKSRLGGSLLSFCRVTVELKESGPGWIVSGVVPADPSRSPGAGDILQFGMLQEGIELLLRLVSDEGALPEVFDATLGFIAACRAGVTHASLGYSFALLHQLGLLPEERELEAMLPLAAADHAYMRACRDGVLATPASACDLERLTALRTLLLTEQITSPLRSGVFLSSLR